MGVLDKSRVLGSERVFLENNKNLMLSLIKFQTKSAALMSIAKAIFDIERIIVSFVTMRKKTS